MSTSPLYFPSGMGVTSTAASQSDYYQTYAPIATQAAQQYGVPTNLFLWQINQESGFNPNAQNGNATGIAQFMPGTAADLGIDPTDPTDSLFGAAQYDSQLYNQYGDWGSVLQHYGTIGPNVPATVNQAGMAQAAAANAGAGGSSGSSTSGTGSFWDNLKNSFSDPTGLGELADAANQGIGPFSVSRIVAILLGLILIAGGIYLFKSVRTVVNDTIKKAGEAAPAVAVA